MEVVIIKTFLGEEILAKLVSDVNETVNGAITLSKPRVFQFQPDGKGGMSTALVPWLMLDPDNTNVPMNLDYIAAHVPANESLTKSYLAAVSSIALLN